MSKRKIIVTRSKPKISDEEIFASMNFDALVSKSEAINNRRTILRWGSIVGVLIIAVAAFHLTDFPPKNEDSDHEVENASLQDPVKTQEDTTFDSSEAYADTLQPKVQEVEVARSLMPKQMDSASVKSSSDEVKAQDESNNSASLPAAETVYVNAEPVDGYEALYVYFDENLRYPVEVLSDSIQGTVMVSFVINVEGKAEQISFTQTLGIPFETEAQRLVTEMPLWRPARLNGKSVASRVVLPISFSIKRIKPDR